MKIRIKRLSPLQAGKMLGMFYVIIGCIAVPFVLLVSLMDSEALPYGIGLAFVFPILYGVMGFVVGMVGALIYNAVAGMAGGIELDFVEAEKA